MSYDNKWDLRESNSDLISVWIIFVEFKVKWKENTNAPNAGFARKLHAFKAYFTVRFFLSFITSVLYLNYVKIEVMPEDEAAMVATDGGGWRGWYRPCLSNVTVCCKHRIQHTPRFLYINPPPLFIVQVRQNTAAI